MNVRIQKIFDWQRDSALCWRTQLEAKAFGLLSTLNKVGLFGEKKMDEKSRLLGFKLSGFL